MLRARQQNWIALQISIQPLSESTRETASGCAPPLVDECLFDIFPVEPVVLGKLSDRFSPVHAFGKNGRAD